MRTIQIVKNVLADGEPCRKRVRAEELLRSRGVWEHIDEVLVLRDTGPGLPMRRSPAALSSEEAFAGAADWPFGGLELNPLALWSSTRAWHCIRERGVPM